MASDPQPDPLDEGAPPAEAPPAEAPPAEPLPAEPPPAKPSRRRRFATATRAWAARMRERFVWMREHYGRMDPRTAGLYRIVVGALCAADAIRHWSYARTFYSNDGVLSNHYHLFRPSSGYNFSFFHAFSSIEEVHVAFAIAVFCHLALMVGWRSRLFAILTFVMVTSLDNRLVMVENGGYVVVNLVTMYAMFLPIDRRFSVDAWLRSYRERRERTVADLDAHAKPAWAKDDYVSLAVFLVVLNLAVVYFFNVINKSGWIWRKGETVHYVLFLNRMVTGVAVLFRNLLPMWATRVVTFYVVAHEALLVPFILWPYARRLTRTLAMIGVFTLHVAFGVMFRLGPFSWFMIGWSFALVTREQWDSLEAWYRRRARPRTVVYDRGAPLAFALMRVLARLDGLELLRFEESAPDAALPPLFASIDDEGGTTRTGVEALRDLAQALPAGRYLFPILHVLTLGLAGPLLAFAGARRAGLARFFGLTVPPPSGPVDRSDEPSPLRLAARRALGWTRELALVYFAVCAIFQAVAENKAVPPWLKPPMTNFMQATIGYPRLYQGWGMFAPNPITDDGSITIDARTIDGRKIDPFTGKEPDLDLTDAEGLGLGQIPQDYFNRIRLDHNTVYRQGLQEYLRAWHLRTGRPQDELVAFDVYWVRCQCPPIGEKKPYANETMAILSWRKPAYRPPAGMPELPPVPKIQSAETAQPEKPKEPRRLFGHKLPEFLQQ